MKRRYRTLIPGMALLGGCMTAPRTVGIAPGAYLAANQPSRAWLVTNDDQEMMMEGPRVLSDTVWGLIDGRQVSIDVALLKDVKVRRVSVLRTMTIPAAVLAAAIGGVVLVKSTQPSIDPFEGDSHDQPDQDPNQ